MNDITSSFANDTALGMPLAYVAAISFALLHLAIFLIALRHCRKFNII